MTDDATIEDALREVRNECRKAALVYALVDAAAVFLGVNAVLAALDPAAVPADVTLPAAVGEPLAGPLGLARPVGVPGSAVVALAGGLVAFAAETWLRLRRPLVEQFEAANPAVAESLRTARDAVADGADSPMARRLYADVLDGLRESSGLALVDARRVLAPAVVVVVLAVLTPGAAVVDIVAVDGGPGDNATAGETTETYPGLRDGDSVLGDSESVRAGEEELTAAVESGGAAGSEDDTPRQLPATEGDGSVAGAGSVDGQQAGFAAPERVEEAELVREYHRRIRAEETE
jgi:hypothetical protein